MTTKGGMPAWLLRAYETSSTLINEKTGIQNKSYGTVVVRSLWWPGSYTFYSNGRTMQIYCGDGLKMDQPGVSFYPVLPPTMIDEKEEKKCYDEPNPTQEWLDAKQALEDKKNEPKLEAE